MSESFSTISPRKSHARVKSGEDMMDVLAHDIMRYEMLSEQDEYKALASILQGNESEDFEFELQEVQLQPLPELQAVDDQFESEDPGAQPEDKERNKRYVDAQESEVLSIIRYRGTSKIAGKLSAIFEVPLYLIIDRTSDSCGRYKFTGHR